MASLTQCDIDNMSPTQAYEYTTIHGFTPELEDIISTSERYSFQYARGILHNRFFAGEKIIATDALCSYLYARDVLDSRFRIGESVILGIPCNAYGYARDIMHRRWLKAEPIIRKSEYWDDYKRDFNIT